MANPSARTPSANVAADALCFAYLVVAKALAPPVPAFARAVETGVE
jgi:hypothetical protein